MEIKRYYFTAEQALLQIQKKETEQEKSAMTEEERAERVKDIQRRLNDLYAQIEMEEKHCKRIIDMQKWEYFQEIAQEAIYWARDMITDLYAGITEQLRGKIQFKTNMLLFSSEISCAYRAYFLKLVKMADDVSFYIDDNACIMDFSFKLYHESRI